MPENDDLAGWTRRLRAAGLDPPMLAALFPPGVDPAVRLNQLRAHLQQTEARAPVAFADAQRDVETWRAACACNAEAREALARRMRQLTPRTPMTERERLWAEDQRLTDTEGALSATFARVIERVERAIASDDADAARALLARLYLDRATTLGAQPAAAAYFRARAARYDRGALRAALSTTASLTVCAEGAVRLVQQIPNGPHRRDVEVPADADWRALRAGSYVVEVSADGRMPARIPVRLNGGEDRRLRVTAPPAFPGHEAFVWVPAGVYPVGCDAPGALPARDVDISAFLIGRHPVTLQAYCDFLNAVAATHGVFAAQARAPRSNDGSVAYLARVDGRFVVPTVDADGDAWDPACPALAVNVRDALAYCAWRTEISGIEHRLPTEVEWEIAARGVDGRAYPWGDGFDPLLCHMADSHAGPPAPRPVGSARHDRSPFGVHDMAGCISEWTSSRAPSGDHVQRGGAWSSPAGWCRVAGRRTQLGDWTSPQVGFRVVRAVPLDAASAVSATVSSAPPLAETTER